jgi:hypothetical protein
MAASARSPGWRSSPGRRLRSTGDWLPDDTLDAFVKYLVGIKGPLTTPVGGGIRSLNVALRQILDLYTCLRPVRYFDRRAEPGQAPRKDRHGHLPRELGRHLRRHRVRARQRRCSQVQAALRRGVPRAFQEDPLPRDHRHRHQAGQPGGHHPPRQGRDPIRDRQRPQVGDPGAQGQHHEVHRGRLPRLGLPGRQAEDFGAWNLDGGPWCVGFKIPRPAKASSSRT